MGKKYQIISGSEEKLHYVTRTGATGRDTVFRIQALKNIPNKGIKAGDLGGRISTEWNLSQSGSAWVGFDAVVMGLARVTDQAYVHGRATVFDSANITKWAQVFDTARIHGRATIKGATKVGGSAEVYGVAMISGHAHVEGNAEIHGRPVSIFGGVQCVITEHAHVKDDAKVVDAKVSGKACISGSAQLWGTTEVRNYALVADQAIVKDSIVSDHAYVGGDAALIGHTVRDHAIVMTTPLDLICAGHRVIDGPQQWDDKFRSVFAIPKRGFSALSINREQTRMLDFIQWFHTLCAEFEVYSVAYTTDCAVIELPEHHIRSLLRKLQIPDTRVVCGGERLLLKLHDLRALRDLDLYRGAS